MYFVFKKLLQAKVKDFISLKLSDVSPVRASSVTIKSKTILHPLYIYMRYVKSHKNGNIKAYCPSLIVHLN